ncbi:sarcosine oxidase subunit delta [Steroidobacter flavus]|uniref:Sarcosine oxidase subunit delta n=1 Tax=Steroidobacter flavus TaxID=1842136 RepID=A0ABV8SXB7_9GAMM
MRIHCPFCGPRDWSEFSSLGDASVRRPHPSASGEFVDAVYMRGNPAGRHEELWYHAFGCRGWLRVTRDTRTHEVFAVEMCDAGVGA